MQRECPEVNVMKLKCYFGECPGLKLAFLSHVVEMVLKGIRFGTRVYVTPSSLRPQGPAASLARRRCRATATG